MFTWHLMLESFIEKVIVQMIRFKTTQNLKYRKS